MVCTNLDLILAGLYMNSSHTKVTGAALLVTLGIVFGDIGTSPLYVISAIVGKNSISSELVLGGLSCVFGH